MIADQVAERAVLGAMLQSGQAVKDVQAAVTGPEDFHWPPHRDVYSAILDKASAGRPVDPIMLGETFGPSRRLELFGYVEACPAPSQAAHYAGIVADLAVRRRLAVAAERVTQRARNLDVTVPDLGRWAVEQITQARDTARVVDGGPANLDEFLSGDTEAEEWVINGLLAKWERFMLTSEPGLGKTLVTRQMAVTTAAGLHPFELGFTTPRSVLVVDCENPTGLNRKWFARLRHACKTIGAPVDPELLHIVSRPEGLDLLRGPDRAGLVRWVERTKPELIVIGPVYRLHTDDPDKEQPARQVTAALNEAQQAGGGAALVLEHHTPHTQQGSPVQRPVGSSLWRRWPSYGRYLALSPNSDMSSRVCSLDDWRGDRDVRFWPPGLRADRSGSGFPWQPTTSWRDRV